MTMPVVPETAVVLPWRHAMAARCAVAAAYPLARMSPKRLRRTLTVLRRFARPADHEQTLAARRAVVSVSAHCAGQGCLQRSVATALLCRARGVWPDWCTGVRTHPFTAHAWVEVDGTAVGEAVETGLFVPLLRVAAEPGRVR